MFRCVKAVACLICWLFTMISSIWLDSTMNYIRGGLNQPQNNRGWFNQKKVPTANWINQAWFNHQLQLISNWSPIDSSGDRLRSIQLEKGTHRELNQWPKSTTFLVNSSGNQQPWLFRRRLRLGRHWVDQGDRAPTRMPEVRKKGLKFDELFIACKRHF